MRYRHPLPTGTPVRDRLMLVLVAERWGLHVAATRIARIDQDRLAGLEADGVVDEDVGQGLPAGVGHRGVAP